MQATEKLNLNAGFTFNYADDSWDWKFTERKRVESFRDIDGDAANNGPGGLDILATNGVEVPGMLGSVNYDDWQTNNQIDEYSDLSYEQYSFTLGATYNFTDALYTKVSGTYDIFESDEEYVYDDEDGKSYSGYLAIGYKF